MATSGGSGCSVSGDVHVGVGQDDEEGLLHCTRVNRML